MSKRYMIILILVNVLTRLGTGYKIIGGSVPEDRDTIIVIDSSPVNLYFSITNKVLHIAIRRFTVMRLISGQIC